MAFSCAFWQNLFEDVQRNATRKIVFFCFSDVLAIDPTSVRSNIDVAKIYSSILPSAYRDNEFAMICVQRALLFHPNSSKANHRMASMLISAVSSFDTTDLLVRGVVH